MLKNCCYAFLLFNHINLRNGTETVNRCITNSYHSFQNTPVISTGLSDFHKMPVTVLKTKFEKTKPKEITYRNYKNSTKMILNLS